MIARGHVLRHGWRRDGRHEGIVTSSRIRLLPLRVFPFGIGVAGRVNDQQRRAFQRLLVAAVQTADSFEP